MQNLVPRDYSKCICTCTYTHACTHAHTHTHTHKGNSTQKHSDNTNIHSPPPKMGMKWRLEMDKDSSMKQKTWQVYNFGKRNVFRLDLNESRKGFCRRGRGRSFHVDGPRTQKARGTNSGESGARNLEIKSIRSRVESTGECVIHRQQWMRWGWDGEAKKESKTQLTRARTLRNSRVSNWSNVLRCG